MNSRRRFLQTVLLASGATFVGLPLGCSGDSPRPRSTPRQVRSADPRPAVSTSGQRFADVHRMLLDSTAATPPVHSRRRCDVVVIGAGPSGLTACRLLHKLGMDTVLLDSEPRFGGAAVNGEWKDITYPLGSVYLVEYEGLIREMVEEAGAAPLLTPEDALRLGDQSFLDFWKDAVIDTMPVPRSDKDALRRFRDDLLSLRVEPLYPLPARLTPALAALDRQSAREYLARYNSDLLNRIINSYSMSSMGGPIDDVNAYCLLNFYSSEFGDSFGMPRYTFRGGLHEFADIIARPIPQEARLYEHIAFETVNTDDGVVVRALDGGNRVVEITARAAVIAVQKFAVPFLVPDLPDVQKKAISQLRYSPFATIHLCSNRALMPHDHFDTWVLDKEQYYTDILNPSSLMPRDSRAFVHSLYAPQPLNERSFLMSEELFADYARRAAEAALPILGGKDAADAIEEIHCWAWGHSVVRAGVGTHSGVAQLASRPFGNIFFANTDNDASPSVESAVQHGMMAAEAVSGHVRKIIKGNVTR